MTSTNAPRFLSTGQGRAAVAMFASMVVWLLAALPDSKLFGWFFAAAVASAVTSVAYAYAYDRSVRVVTEAVTPDGR